MLPDHTPLSHKCQPHRFNYEVGHTYMREEDRVMELVGKSVRKLIVVSDTHSVVYHHNKCINSKLFPILGSKVKCILICESPFHISS